MHFSWLSFKFIVLFFFIFLPNIWAKDSLFHTSIQKLKTQIKKDLKDEVPADYIEKIFSSPNLKYNPQIMIKRLTWKEAKLPYHQFLEKARIERAKKFMQENKKLLTDIENTFNVEKELLTAIFLVETNLGENTGKYPVINVYFSLALSGEKKLFEKSITDSEISLEDKLIKERWKKRSKWGYEELLYFIKICYQNNLNPFSIKGSIFGAFGYPQFVPKSYLIYGYDWNKDGKIDLYELGDALASMANYLKSEGYKKEADLEYKKYIIMKYNVSEPYADTVLKIANLLKEKD